MKQALVVLAMVLLVGCSAVSKGPAVPPREQIRAGVVLVAYAVKGLDRVCSETAYALAEQDPDFKPPTSMRADDPAPGRPPFAFTGAKLDAAIKLAKRCDAAYEAVRDALIAVDNLLDASTDNLLDRDARTKKVGCAMGRALAALDEYLAALKEAGVADVPPEVQDAVAIARTLSGLSGGSCDLGGGR